MRILRPDTHALLPAVLVALLVRRARTGERRRKDHRSLHPRRIAERVQPEGIQRSAERTERRNRRVFQLRPADPPEPSWRRPDAEAVGRRRRHAHDGRSRPPRPSEGDRARAHRRLGAAAGRLRTIHPGVVPVNIASALSSLPTPLLATIAFLLDLPAAGRALLSATASGMSAAPLSTPPPGAAPPRRQRRGAARPRNRLPGGARRRMLRADALWWTTLLTAGIACLITFLAKGGLNLESMTTTEIVLTLASAAWRWRRPHARRAMPVQRAKHGLWPVGLLLAFAALSGLSVVWSVQPDVSWQGRGRAARLRRRVRRGGGARAPGARSLAGGPRRAGAGGGGRVRLRAGDQGLPRALARANTAHIRAPARNRTATGTRSA